jgi:hypothetical protein
MPTLVFISVAFLNKILAEFHRWRNAKRPKLPKGRNDQVRSRVFFHLFLRLIALLDKSLGDRMSTLREKRLRALHESQVQLAL